MKTLALACVLSLCSVAAYAGTQTLPEPSLAQITGISNLGSETPNDIATTRGHQAITGWSADGTKLYGVTSGTWPYGYRGSRTASWCGTLTWTITVNQATGALNPIGTATYAPGNCNGTSNSSQTFYVLIGGLTYGANAAPQPDEFSPGTYLDIATLLTP